MYGRFFGFQENPFNLTPDPRYLFLSRYHREALDHLLYGINERKGFIAITGGIGAGKTTLCRALLNHLDSRVKTALIFSSFLSDVELLHTINQEFGISASKDPGSKREAIDALNRFLLENYRSGQNALLLIDEAQNLSRDVLEQIRMLSNLETEKDKLIQVVLVGQSELKAILESPSLKQLNERITVRYHLKPLNPEDMEGYVRHRISIAGGQGQNFFTKGAFQKIYAYSQGNPRRINAVCDRALLVAYGDGTRMVTGPMVSKAVRELKGEAEAGPQKAGTTRRRFLLAGGVSLMVVGAGFAGWYLHGAARVLSNQSPSGTIPDAPPPVEALAPVPEAPSQEGIFLDEKGSLGELFSLYQPLETPLLPSGEGVALTLVSFDLGPEVLSLLKRPFRVRVRDEDVSRGSWRYLLLVETTFQEAIALTASGKRQVLPRPFLLENWGGQVSFLYGGEPDQVLKAGSRGRHVLEMQKTLRALGYPAQENGTYDRDTARAIRSFQRDFGLEQDGVAGPRTLALLVQMTARDHEQHP